MATAELDQEVARRRKVVSIIGLSLAGIAFRGVMQLSTSSVRTMTDYCLTTVPAVGSIPAVTVKMRCHPRQVHVVSSWRWPVLAVVLVLVGIGVGYIWLRMPRHTTVETVPTVVVPLEGRVAKSAIRYQVAPGQKWLMYAFGAPFVIGGLLLGILPSGAPVAIYVGFIAAGLILFYGAGAGTATATPERITMRTQLRRKSWRWDDVARVEAADGFVGPARMKRRMVVVHSNDGKVFMNQALSSPPGHGTASRADQLAAAVELQRVEHKMNAVSAQFAGPPTWAEN